MPENSEVVEARSKQRAASKRATLAKLKKKKRNEREVTINIDGDDLTLLFRAIGMQEYDDLLAKHPPTREQREQGAAYNALTFGPALVAAVSVEPKLTEEDTKEIWESGDWSRGDLGVLWETALAVNFEGFDVPFSGRG